MSFNLIQIAQNYRKYSQALYPALRDDPFYRTLESRVEDASRSKEAMLDYYDYSIFEADRHGLSVRPNDPFGVSVWSVPLDPDRAVQKSEDKTRFIRQQMGETCLEVYDKIDAFMARAAADLISDSDWYLSILGILPSRQGMGLGEGLIRPVLEKADCAGVATFLETFTPRNMRFYERFGYVAAGKFREPVTDAEYWLMRRAPEQF